MRISIMKKVLFLLAFVIPFAGIAQRTFDLSHIQQPGVPSLSEVGSFGAYSTTAGTASGSQTVTISGSNLTANVSVSFPAGYEVSIAGGAFTSTSPVTITQSGGSLPGQPVNFTMRLLASDAAGSYPGNVVFSSTGASSVTLSVSGTVSSSGGGGTVFKAITIDHTKVANTDQTNFPMTFDITANWLKDASNGGSVANSTKNNIVVYLDGAGTTPAKYEIVTWDGSAGRVTGVVTIPTLSHTTNSQVWISAGNSSISTSQSPSSCWDANFQRVWHMDEVLTASGQTVKDWSSNAANMTSQGTWTSAQSVSGQVGNGLKLQNANGTYLSFTTLSLTTDYTLEGWFNPTSATVDGDTYTYAGTSSNDNMAWGDPAGFVGLYTNNGGNKILDAAPVSANNWVHFVITRVGANWTMYRNGVATATSTQATNLSINDVGFVFGTVTNDIICDELRISNIARSADWIATEYNNQSSPSTFYTVAP